ncbi:MAG: MATE family efflux transporter [Rhodothermales bacterium]|nr:MATE family efflux transporter [Rhodothermales bacterium]
MPHYRIPIVRRELKETLALALPVVGSQLGLMSMGFVDTVMVGRLGPEALAAVALGSTLYFFMAIVCMGVVFAVGPMVSQAYGARDYEVIGRSVRQGLWMGVVLAVPSIFLLRNANLVFEWMGHEPATATLATAYLRAIVWGFVPFLWFAALRGFVEGVSRPFPVTVITLMGLGLNIVANYVLMYGKLGFPALGVVGAGYASATVFWVMCGVLAMLARRHPTLKPFAVFTKLRKPDREYFGKLFRIGWPIGALHGVEAGLFAITALLIGVIGTTDLAAHQVAIQFAAFTFMVPLGIGIATSVRVGQAVGRGDPVGTRWAGYVGIALAIGFMGCAAILLWAAPEAVVALYLDVDDPANTEVVALAVRLLGFAALFQVFDGAQVSAAGALRGLKDTRGPMVIGILSYWGIGLSTGCLLGFGFDRGAVGLWTGLVLGLVFASVALIWRFAFASRRASNRMVEEASA